MAEKAEKTQHLLVPVHKKISEKEKAELLKKYNITAMGLPKILINDPAIAGLDAKEGDVIKITRKSHTAGEAAYYRGVTSG